VPSQLDIIKDINVCLQCIGMTKMLGVPIRHDEPGSNCEPHLLLSCTWSRINWSFV